MSQTLATGVLPPTALPRGHLLADVPAGPPGLSLRYNATQGQGGLAQSEGLSRAELRSNAAPNRPPAKLPTTRTLYRPEGQRKLSREQWPLNTKHQCRLGTQRLN